MAKTPKQIGFEEKGKMAQRSTDVYLPKEGSKEVTALLEMRCILPEQAVVIGCRRAEKSSGGSREPPRWYVPPASGCTTTTRQAS